MTRSARTLLMLIGLALPLSALPESRLVTGSGQSASATVKLRVVVPPIVRVLGNQHPAAIAVADGSAQQELEVLTTMRQGFCAVLSLNTTGVRQWSVQSNSAGVQVMRAGDGYRVCAPRNGRYRVALEHRFELDVAGSALTTAQLPWPVQTELSAL
ncbi:MAG: hypothetical protein KF871_00850 [Hydrogenophaga sp.]|uniref:hypothetical protein n=1 Tax=Hydrogenophaga sp. TaxID=1904254 RepID=UPI001DF40C2B|nr:hypothetical protein [Hydrogenophaga sp.]MBX3608415.1 hypothetical protein [Hydrogenophaga sp.]